LSDNLHIVDSIVTGAICQGHVDVYAMNNFLRNNFHPVNATLISLLVWRMVI
jgi:hypothetical protein